MGDDQQEFFLEKMYLRALHDRHDRHDEKGLRGTSCALLAASRACVFAVGALVPMPGFDMLKSVRCRE